MQAELNAAREIWSAAGIDLHIVLHDKFSESETQGFIGDDDQLDAVMGTIERFKYGSSAEEAALRNLWGPKGIAIHFIQGMGNLSNPSLHQSYVSLGEDTPVGRTMAHEIGHLLLERENALSGDAHEYGGLMAPFPSGSVEISEEMANKARLRAVQLMELM
jgi:hypothetical protein